MPIPCSTPIPTGQLTDGRAWGYLHPQGKGLSQSLPQRPHHGARSLCSSLLLGGVYSSAQSLKGCRRFQGLGCCPGCPVHPAPKVTGGFMASTDRVVFSRLPAPVHLSPHSTAQRNWPPPGSPPVLLSLRDSAASALHSPRRYALEAGRQALPGGDSLDPPHKALLVQNADGPEAHILATPPFHLRQLQSRGWRWTCSRTQIWGSSGSQMGSLFVFGQK